MKRGSSRLTGIYAIADDAPGWRHDVRAQVAAALAGGAPTLQLRLKHTIDREALALARWAVARAREAGALLIVNDRFDLAELAGADGVHVGADDLPPDRIPAASRARLLVGYSTHTVEQARASRELPVDYLGFGPVFATRTKESSHDPRGLGALAEAVEAAELPVVAIGGIHAGNVAEVAKSGAAAAAVISALADAEDPAGETRRLRERFARAAPRGAA